MKNRTYVVFDLETVCTSHEDKTIIEIGAVKIENGRITDTFDRLINPEREIPEIISDITGITDDTVKDMPKAAEVLPEFKKFCGSAVMVAHDAGYDMSVLNIVAKRNGMYFGNKTMDTLKMSRELYPDETKHNLGIMCERLGVELKRPHRANEDAMATAQCFIKIMEIHNWKYNLN